MYNGNQVHVISHVDLDGMCAAAIVRQQYPDAYVILTNYKKELRLNKFKTGDTVFVTDFSLSKEVFEILASRGCRIIWIDHHQQTYEMLQSQGWSCEGIRRAEYSGAMLTWMYFNPDKTFEQAPDFIKLVNWYDLWQHDKDPRIRAFSYGIGLWDCRPGYISGDRIWNKLFSSVEGDHTLDLIVKYGADVQKYIEKSQDIYCKDLAYRTTLSTSAGTKNILAMAFRPGNSSVFERQDVSTVDALFVGQYVSSTVRQYRCSMYSPDNVKEILSIVNQFGGGGHPTAAGFTVPRYPINYPDRTKPMPLEEAVKMYDELYKMRKSSPILLKYANRSNGVTTKVCGWHTKLLNYNVIAFNYPYIPECLDTLPTSVDCVDEVSGEVADLYVGFIMTNSGLFRCCAYPTSTSVRAEDVLIKLQDKYMKDLTEDTFNFKLINGGVWWYQPEEPINVPINFNIQSSSVN